MLLRNMVFQFENKNGLKSDTFLKGWRGSVAGSSSIFIINLINSANALFCNGSIINLVHLKQKLKKRVFKK